MTTKRVNIFYKSGKGSAIAFVGSDLKARYYRYTAERAYLIKALLISRNWKMGITETSNTFRKL